MEQLRVRLFSTSQLGGVLAIAYSPEQSQIALDLLYLFGAEMDVEVHAIKLSYRQRNTAEFRKRLAEFIEAYKDRLPQIQQLGGKFKKLGDDEWFFILPPQPLTTLQKYKLEQELDELNGRAAVVSDEDMMAFVDGILGNYEIITFDLDKEKKIKIGEGAKAKRVCRFCKGRIPEVTFKKEAHAISEALGNKKLILNEECDSCNEFFDENVERDFIYYHDLTRTVFGVLNKDNEVPKLKGKGFSVFKTDEHLSIALVSGDNAVPKDAPPERTLLKTGNKIRLQNIYKALCKFALSAIDDEFMGHFAETVAWLKGKKTAGDLPKVAVLPSYHFVTRRSELTLYLRNNANTTLPYLVGEFRIALYVYIFIVPFSDMDDEDFLGEESYANFLNCFKQINVKQGFDFADFSQNIERDLNFDIKFQRSEV